MTRPPFSRLLGVFLFGLVTMPICLHTRDISQTNLVQRRSLEKDTSLQKVLNHKFDSDPFVHSCHIYDDVFFFLYDLTAGRAHCYVLLSMGACSPMKLSPPSHSLLAYATPSNNLVRLNLEPFTWSGVHRIDMNSPAFKAFADFLKVAGIQVKSAPRATLAYLFAYLVLHDKPDEFPVGVLLSSDDVGSQEDRLSCEQRQVLDLPAEAVRLRDSRNFSTYIRFNNGGVLRVTMTLNESGGLETVEWANVWELAK